MAIKTLFLAIFDPHLSIVKSVFDCRLSGVFLNFDTVISFLIIFLLFTTDKSALSSAYVPWWFILQTLWIQIRLLP